MTRSVASLLLLTSLAMLALGNYQKGTATMVSAPPMEQEPTGQTITSMPFGEMNGNDVFNASGVVPLADSRFLFCDNNSNDALFELDLTATGQKKGQLIKRPLHGLAADAIDDLEAMTLAEERGRRFVFVTSSLYVKKAKDGQPQKVQPSGLLRVTIKSDGSLVAENLLGFRDWFIKHVPSLAAAANLVPDEGGLNIEGLAWDRSRHALLFGVRTPLSGGKALVIPVRVKKLRGSWTTDNLEMLPAIRLSLNAAEGEQGIRSIEYITSRHAFLVIVGKTISESKVPYALYEWDGSQRGQMRQLKITFAEKMKPEGVTSGRVGGKPVLLFVDDAGGYQVVRPGLRLFKADAAKK